MTDMFKQIIKAILRKIFARNIDALVIPDGIQVVSFDLYDTLIVRKTGRPENVFGEIERIIHERQNSHEEFFSKRRIQAERSARKKKKAEITLDDIYDELRSIDKCNYEELKSLEVQTEFEVSIPKPEAIDKLKQILRCGMTVIITSDMYLPKETIEMIIRKCGITGYKDLYVSSECGVTKKSGKLFKYILGDKEISANEMIHIGDNPIGDYYVPRKIGIKAFLCK